MEDTPSCSPALDTDLEGETTQKHCTTVAGTVTSLGVCRTHWKQTTHILKYVCHVEDIAYDTQPLPPPPLKDTLQTYTVPSHYNFIPHSLHRTPSHHKQHTLTHTQHTLTLHTPHAHYTPSPPTQHTLTPHTPHPHHTPSPPTWHTLTP